MKYIDKLFYTAAVIFFAASCTTKEILPESHEEAIPEGYEKVAFSVTTQDVKTMRPEKGEFAGKTVWVKNDQLKMLYESGSATATLQGDGGSISGTFLAVLPGGVQQVYAVYPNALVSSLDEGSVSVTVPAVQDGSFATCNIAVAKADAEKNLAFYNINTLLKVIVGSGVTRISVESVDGSPLVGTANVSFTGSGIEFGENTGGASSFVSNLPGDAGTYYFSVLSGVTHSKGLFLKYYKGEEESGKYLLDKSVKTTVNKILSFGEFEPTNNYYVTVSGAGNKNGLSWANAMDVAAFKKLVFSSSSYSGTRDDDADILKYSTLNGATVHMGAGDYVVASANADKPTIGFAESLGTAFHLYIIGGYDANGSATPDPSKNVTAIKGNGVEGVGRLINLEYKSNVHFDGITFTENHGDIGGAAAVRIVHGTQHFNNCRFVDNKNTASACAMHVGNGKAYLTGCVFSGNTSTEGCCINVSGNSATYVSAKNCIFTGNDASEYGGAIRVENGTLEVEGGSFTENTATKRGGAVYIKTADAKVLIDGASFEGNGKCTAASPDGQGGAIFSNTSQNVDIKNCTFTDNTARIAGAIGSAEDKSANINIINIDSCSFAGNSSTAILFANSGEINISNSTFTGNTSTSKGGALAINGWDSATTATLTDCTFSDNTASDYGGAIRLEEGILNVNGGSFSGNTASKQGGAIWINTAKVSAGIVGATFTQNGGCTAASPYGQGGAVYTANGGTVEISGCTFTSNSARVGGAIGSVDPSNTNTISVDGCDFNGNTSTGVGGAVIITSKGQMRLTNSTFTSNEAGSNGGAIRADDANLTLTIDNVAFNSNYAKGSGIGGALYIENGKYRINKTCFNGNHSTTSGAICSCGTNTTYLNNCLFTGNYISSTSGTTIRAWSTGAKLFMNNCTFADDTYTTKSDANGNNCCWLYFKGTKTVISNCTLIGYSRKGTNGATNSGGAALTAFDSENGSGTVYLINNIIAHRRTTVANSGLRKANGTLTLNTTSNKTSGFTSATPSSSGTDAVDFWGTSDYFGGLTYVSNENPAWNNCYWQWNGTLDTGSNLNKDTAENIINAINTADSDFKSWLDEVDGLYYDGQGNFRGNGNWWPGAYQGEATTPAGTSIKVMSFNTLYLGYDDKQLDNGVVKDIKPERTWAQRAPGCYAMISGIGPDIIGMQECEGAQKKDYVANCTAYGVYGVSRTSGTETGTSEEVPILYKKSVLSVESKGTFWLSSTPSRPGTSHSKADAPRPATWAVMKVKSTNQKFFFVNAHLSTDDEARSFEIGVLLSGINSRNTGSLPVIITGDQNKIDEDACFDAFRNAGYTCTRRSAPETDKGITFHAFGFKEGTIDNIWQKGCTAVNSFTVDRQTWSGVQYISDHYPVYSTIVL